MGSKFRSTKLLVAIAAFGLITLRPASANTVYAVHDSDLGVFVDGTITTDGKVGELDLPDIVGWDLSLSGVGVTPVTLTENNSSSILQGGAGDLSATPTALLWDYSSNGTLEFLLQQGNLSAFIIYDQSLFIAGEQFFIGCCIDPGGVERFGTETFATVTPVPAALPLFASALGTMGLLGWWRKRRAQLFA